MAKKFKVEGKIVEETEFYKVIKSDENGKFYIFSKYDDSIYTADKYKIVGAAVLQDLKGEKTYSNMVNMQPYGQGRTPSNVITIDSWKSKKTSGKEQTAVKYFDEKGFTYVRHIDEQGNLYKKQKCRTKDAETLSV